MNIALIGYGKMGKAIEAIALERGHQIVLTIDLHNATDLTAANLAKADVAIEFTSPHSAFDNVVKCLEAGVPLVCGSTGWLDKWNEVAALCKKKNGAMVYASNYSVGVNIFFEVNKRLAELMAPHAAYNVKMEEIHHTQKKDSPSGTAVTLAEQVLERVSRKKEWINAAAADASQLEIISERIDPAPGTHKVLYTSSIDDIEIIHTAHNRTGFATGAVLAAEFLATGRKGIFSMKEVLGL
ncbi:MAG TPA: 4-hydroxy-tetrahydrodipicolinate reductase [Chitinophagaceae bacterium]|nr:4-hydroxy-tetrahydrodipicolinate reductase [Chitinophagaceae bacterium]